MLRFVPGHVAPMPDVQWINGIVEVRSACSRVASRQTLAPLNSFEGNLSIKVSGLRVRHAPMLLRRTQGDARGLVYPAVRFHVAIEAKQVTLIQLRPQNLPRAVKHLADGELLPGRVTVMERHGLDAAVIAATHAPAAEVVDAPFLGQVPPVERLAGDARALLLAQAVQVLVVAVIAPGLVNGLSGLRKRARPLADLELLAVAAYPLNRGWE
jgi:hypothetical protein